MPAMMTMAGPAVDSIEIARPWITLVPWPETDDAAFEQRHAGVLHTRQRTEADQPVDDAGNGQQRQHTGHDQALVQRAHDGLAGAELDEEGADDRGDDAGAANGERQR